MPVIEELSDDETEADRDARWAETAKVEAERVQIQFDKGDASQTDAKALFAQDKYEEAIEKWKEAEKHLLTVGNQPDDRDKAEKANLAINLNVALAHLKLENWQAAKDAASSAWCTDQKNVKALFRRGLAQAAIARSAASLQEADAVAACEDFEELLKVEPTNMEAKRELHQLKLEIRNQKKEMLENQRATWAGKLGGRTVLPGDDEKEDDKPLSMLRPYVEKAVQGGRHSVMFCEGVAVGKGRNGPVLSDVDLNLPEKWCVGIYTEDNPEKKAFLDLITHKIRPSAGKLEFPKKHKTGVNPAEVTHITTPIMSATVAVATAICWGMLNSKLDWFICIILAMIMVMSVPLVVYLWWEQQVEQRPPAVLHASPAGYKAWKPLESKTVLLLLEEALPKRIPKEERPARADNLLKAVGLQDLDGSATYGSLSKNQQQLVYILRCFVMRTKVLIFDHVLDGLEPQEQSRVLRMLRRYKVDCNTSIVYISTDMQQLSLVSDSLGLLKGGKLCELGPAGEVLAHPRHPDMKELMDSSDLRGVLSGGLATAGGLRDFYNDLIKDSALEAMWLPKHKD